MMMETLAACREVRVQEKITIEGNIHGSGISNNHNYC